MTASPAVFLTLFTLLSISFVGDISFRKPMRLDTEIDRRELHHL